MYYVYMRFRFKLSAAIAVVDVRAAGIFDPILIECLKNLSFVPRREIVTENQARWLSQKKETNCLEC